MTRPRRLPPLLLLAACVSARPLLAWSPEAHRAIVRTAARLSPELETRLPSTARDTFWELLAAADPLDDTCVTHRDLNGGVEAAAQAARLLSDLRAGRAGKTPRQRAGALGRLLHFVVDCAIPRAAVGQEEQTGDGDMVVFRVARPIVEPVEAQLRARAEEAFWSDATPSSGMGPAFRAAVNLVLDMAPLLPPWDPATATVPPSFDTAPVLFVANRWVVPLGKVQRSFGSPAIDFSSNSLLSKVLAKVASGKLDQVPLLAFPGLSLVEWSRAENGQKVRLLLANGADVCAFGIRVTFGEYETNLVASLPPRSLKIVEIDGPKRAPLSTKDVKLDATFGTCVDDAGPRPVPTGWRLICSSPGRWPDVENAVEVRLPDLPPIPPDRVPFALGATVALGGLELNDLSVRLGPAGWVFEAEIANSGDFKARPLTVDVEMGSEGSARPPERRTLVYTLGNLRRGQAGKFSSVVAARAGDRGATPRFRIVSVRQVEAAAPADRKVTLGVE